MTICKSNIITICANISLASINVTKVYCVGVELMRIDKEPSCKKTVILTVVYARCSAEARLDFCSPQRKAAASVVSEASGSGVPTHCIPSTKTTSANKVC